MQYITLSDFLLFPLYLFFLYFIIKISARKFNGTPLKKYFITAFFLHMGGSFLYALVVQFYYGYGDSFGFYEGGNFIRDYISNGGNPFQIFYISAEDLVKSKTIIQNTSLELPVGIGTDSNFTVMKISAALSYISFNSYLVISLFFGFFAFAGLWKFFRTCNKVLNNNAEKILAISILYTPSIWFWGSGLMKDSICIGIVGFIIHFTYKIFIEKKILIRDILILLVLFYVLFTLKSYIASILIVAFSLGYVILILKKSRQNAIQLLLVSFVIIVSTLFLTYNLSSNIDSIIDESKTQIEIFKGAYEQASAIDENSLAGFKPGDFDLSVSSIIIRSPLAMFSTLFRPFIWESQKLIMFLSALESFLMFIALVFVVFKCGVLRFFYLLISDPFIFFAFIFTLLLAAVVGYTTFNFGTLVRYRLPILPFYFFMLIAIYTKNKLNLLNRQIIPGV